jgi:hypothetical protein
MGGEMNLIEHGILQDESDYRIHVGFVVGAVYVFPTANGKTAVHSGKYRIVNAFQPGCPSPTSQGVVVPWQELAECKEVLIPPGMIQAANCRRSDHTSTKGYWATVIVSLMQTCGMIPIEMSPVIVNDKALQIRGVDLQMKPISIQIKCDFCCGSRDRRGTGNIYLETHERNPFKNY